MTIKRKSIFIVSGLFAAGLTGCDNNDTQITPSNQAELESRNIPTLTVDGLKFKDLNKNGQLDPYEDWRLDSATRARDLTARMNVEEKAGAMMHGTIGLDGAGRVDISAAEEDVNQRFVNTFITRMAGDPQHISADNNALQEMAEKSRLGIPVTISTDPRNHFVNDPNATSVAAGSFSQWPEPLGLAAIDDTALSKTFGDIARQEYRAVGIHMALSPQADLATEPRWGRINGTFGEDNQLAKRQVQAYIEGFQHGDKGLTQDSVITVVKHFAGGGPQLGGLDPHNIFGKEQVYPGDNLEYHLVPFEGAFAANVASVMPYYGQPINLWYKDQLIEEVGFGFNKQVLTEMLRGRFGFTGVVLSDWGILESCEGKCATGISDADIAAGVSPWAAGIGMSWGVENLTRQERVVKAVEAGIDQFGGTSDPSDLIEAINQQQLPIAAIDASVTRILQQKFELGLFEKPYVDEAKAVKIVGNAEFQQQGDDAQRRAQILLQNNNSLLPLALSGKKVFLHNVNATVAARYGLEVVATPEEAEIAILRVDTPHQNDPHYPFGVSVNFGQLGFDDAETVVLDQKAGTYSGSEDYRLIKQVKALNLPTVISVYLDRPAILTNIVDKTDVLLANFGASDEAVLDVITGKSKAQGKLPFELPSSWQAVLDQKEDVAHDSVDPLFPIGAGIL
ncbi:MULTISPECIES: glycoside hydrolase family 3 protein [Serratia]|uniref:glycoside hydrolase family 3 protein n=1 Tax=Serratia TaxID=613 RepID=UPI001AE4EB2E|nr:MULTISPECIES: glycoside hydrolase family 3 N-terminal domain-containing protein [Serratia]MBP1000497.1 glycoside hydrolase family 3 C-terminal domain-containing protein [Serratia fonticola]MBP1005513.1 glycoside hydrolase family 3 C-terminal domain-containing protein [Serratia fonticola]MBP1015191.1 glycoside hydrolase family 3 C-terminal domain-containing protein [Serratia fonticola]MBP1038242.1 glycoside hydrolase family 3 C-terminal domain-containing protein [Serratia fonticola]UAN52048.